MLNSLRDCGFASAMKFTFNWLKDHLETTLSAQEVSEKLTVLGIEVEEVIDYSKILKNFIIGKIKSTEKHPNADKLRVCLVDVGYDKPLQIVCGASNAREGIYVVVALPEAIIPATQLAIKKGTIRNVESQGMMCSASELCLDLECSKNGIIELHSNELPSNVILGQPASVGLKLDDVIYDVSITPNRGDLFCVRGIARQLASAAYGKLKPINVEEFSKTIENSINLKLESKNCKYFSTVAIRNFNGKTPKKISHRLKLCGQKLISCPVDIANYICFDIGQPMHVFDLDKLSKNVCIRDAYAGEKIKTLAGSEETLPEGALIASTDNEPISIVGIIGGESTAVSENSVNLLLESSYFDKTAITKTGQALHVCTDARTRFERGIDPENVNFAQKYFIQILKTVCPNIELSEIKSVGTLPTNKNRISLSYEKFHNVLQFERNDFNHALELLQNLGCKVLEQSNDLITVETPSWRHDLKIEEDLIEEILQLSGFDKIQPVKLPYADPIIEYSRNDNLLDVLIHNGYQECKTFSMLDTKTAELFSPKENIVNIENALSGEFAVLRTTLVASHLKVVLDIQNKSLPLVKIAEIGKQFRIHNNEITEERVLIGTISDIEKPRHWLSKTAVSMFDVKSDVEMLIDQLSAKARLSVTAPGYYHPGRSGSYIYQKDTCIAQFGEIHPMILNSIGIKVPVYCFEVFVDRIPYLKTIIRPISEVSPYQLVKRDFSFLLDKSVPAGTIIDTIKKLHVKEVKDIKIFDVYEADNLGTDKKALTFEITLLSDKCTLTDTVIQDISDKVVDAITQKCNGKLRDK